MSDSDDKIKQISKLLEMGGTMLAQHCTTCGAPLFRYQGNVLCPICQGNDAGAAPQQNAVQATASKDVLANNPDDIPVSFEPPVQQPSTARSTVNSPLLHQSDSVVNSAPSAVVIENMDSVAESLKLKIGHVAGLLQAETDTRRMNEYLDVIAKCINILERLQ